MTQLNTILTKETNMTEEDKVEVEIKVPVEVRQAQKAPAKKKAVKKKAVKKAVKKTIVKEPIISVRTYINTSKYNIFTTAGRVMPLETVALTTDEASHHLHLEEI